MVYEHVNRVKAERYLRTCDLFHAVEYCQLICIFNRIPKLKEFLHNQKGCERIPGLNCDDCEKEKKTSEIQNPLNTHKSLCLKCVDFSKSLNDAKNELKITQNQLKEMERKVLDKEKEILEGSKKIKELQRENLKLKTENETNERMIEQLLDRITNLSISSQKTAQIGT